MTIPRKLTVPILLATLAFAACTSKQNPQPEAASSQPRNAEKHPPHAAPASPSQGGNGFDFYVLALSWAPQFCASHQDARSTTECDSAKHYGFVVHGFWPQNNDGSFPSDCAPAQPVSADLVRQMLPIMPARGLIQHEWATHGTCSGLSPQEYFAEVQQVFGKLKIPAEYQLVAQGIKVSPEAIEQQFASANGAPADAFRTECNNGKLIGVNVCLSKDLQYQSCGNALRGCRAREVTVLPTL